MKRRNFVYFGIVALLAGSLLSCGSEIDPKSYTDITKDEAQTIIDNFDPETALNNIDTIAYEVTMTQNDDYMNASYHVDFREESLYLYYHLDSNNYEGSEVDATYLITGSDDTYTFSTEMATSSYSGSATYEIGYEEAKTYLDNLTYSMLLALVYDEEELEEMEDYGEVTYGTFSNYIKFQVTDEETIDEDNYFYINYYLIYTTDGLLRYGYTEVTETVDGETEDTKLVVSIEYNTTLSKRTSLD